MIKHISARVAWHDNGWNGHICRNPEANTYCIGRYSYPGEMIAQDRDLRREIGVAGCSCAKLEYTPPCGYSINAFGKEQTTAYSKPPEWFRDGSMTKYWNLPPSTVCVWPYEEMYTEEIKNPEGQGQKYNYDKRLQGAKKFFEELTPDKSLIFYYSNYSNPFSEDDEKKYVIVGLSRFKSLGDYLFYDGMSEENKKKYAGGFVWQLPVTSHYPDQGFRLPCHLYIDKPEIIERLILVPENDRNFKYTTRHVSDDDALDIIEHFLEIVENLIELEDKSENWILRKNWLQSLISELWQNRGAFPGLPKVLDYLGFQDAINYFKIEVADNKEIEAKESIFSFLNGKTESIPGLKMSEVVQKKIRRQWKLREDVEQNLLCEILPRFDLSKDQIEKILSPDRSSHGIYASLKEISENPYVLCEQFVGDDPDDRISFNKIDHGMFPSPELGELNNLAEIDDERRLRALCVDQLKKEEKHTFVAASKVINDVNYKLSFYPEWKRHQFNERYFEVDEDELSKALTFREEKGRKYIYLKTAFEDEREIEKHVRLLAKRSDITFKSPVTEKHWNDFLYDNQSPIALKNPREYENSIKGQIEVCQKIFVKPVCVVSGTAGTGKTTIIKAIINAIEKAHGSGTSFKLLAPTGKAADRIREKTGKSASTIHSFLAQKGWLNNNLTFKRSGGLKEEGISTYIIDESSMLDLNLTATLFRAINWATVQRLIFVGDPNQLPPIGKGRIFADIIDWLKDQNPDSEGILKTNIRQMENSLMDKGTGILSLASVYTREVIKTANKKDKLYAEELLKRIQEGGDVDKDLRVCYWKNTDELERILKQTIMYDLKKDFGNIVDENKQFKLWSNAFEGKEEGLRANYQQVISPYRGELFGTENLNTLLQKFINGYNVENKRTFGGITLFDKVIQYINRPRSNPYWAYNKTKRKTEPIDVYNGEIGFVKPHAYDKDKCKWKNFHIKQFQVVFSRKEEYWIEFKSESEVEQNLELAYAISVHKAQGSEFERIYFILPKNKKSLLSTELLYTGITRAQKHLTLLVEEDISPLLSLRRPEKSHLLGINSSLFDFKPVPDEILNIHEWYEEGKIHRTLSDYMVRSKSEVIIANMLFERGIPFKYEMPLFAPDGTFYLPDFTIIWNGEEWYWEHLGRMEDENYRNRWDTKEIWYKKYFPDRLVTTIESGNLSKDAQSIIENHFK
jgi:hypothetical protein